MRLRGTVLAEVVDSVNPRMLSVTPSLCFVLLCFVLMKMLVQSDTVSRAKEFSI